MTETAAVLVTVTVSITVTAATVTVTVTVTVTLTVTVTVTVTVEGVFAGKVEPVNGETETGVPSPKIPLIEAEKVQSFESVKVEKVQSS